MKARAAPNLSTGAMSDIAFLLLIFFVTTTQILDERGIQVILPPIDAQNQPLPETDVFHIYINAANEILADNKRVDIHGLGGVIYEQVVLADLTHSRRTVISLHCARESSYAMFVNVHDCIRSTYKKIWNEMALTMYQKSFNTLSDVQRNGIMKKQPLVVSEADENR